MQELLMEEVPSDLFKEVVFKAIKANEELWKKQLIELGVEFVNFPQADLEKWRSLPAVQKISNDWIEKWEAEGKPARAIMELWLKALG